MTGTGVQNSRKTESMDHHLERHFSTLPTIADDESESDLTSQSPVAALPVDISATASGGEGNTIVPEIDKLEAEDIIVEKVTLLLLGGVIICCCMFANEFFFLMSTDAFVDAYSLWIEGEKPGG
jgi:hypothetical protein